jgi:hypothetical protein
MVEIERMCFVSEKRRCVGARKGSRGMVEIELLCSVSEKRRCLGARKGIHGIVEIKHFVFQVAVSFL